VAGRRRTALGLAALAALLVRDNRLLHQLPIRARPQEEILAGCQQVGDSFSVAE
jgi:hypothetical protein